MAARNATRSRRREQQSAVEATMRHLRTRLRRSGPRGERRLPPERDLAIELGVSRSTLRGALDRLEAEGLIHRHVGQGTFVAARARRAASQAVGPDPVSGSATPLELIDARLVLEPTVAAAAALSASAEAIAAMGHAIQKGSQAADAGLYETWDAAFHEAIVQATGNPVLLACLGPIRSFRRETDWRDERSGLLAGEAFSAYRDRQSVMHRAILDAIAARDPKAARERMVAHLLEVRALWVQSALGSD